MISIDNFSSIPSLTRHKPSFSVETRQSIRLDINVSIGASSTSSFNSAPLDLAYQAAIDRINEEVAPYLGERAIERAYDGGLDVSPDATANRIVSLSTALFPRYERQHPELNQEEALTRFIEVISSGVERGFSEAKEILKGLGVLEGEIESNIDLTFELVLDGFAEFMENYY